MEFSGTANIGGRELKLRSGKLAKQAQGSVEVIYGDTVILSASGISDPKPHLPFFPLTVEYREMAYAGGKIPGGFFKREGRPSSHETVSARLTDRTIRPMFPDDYKNEVLVVSTVLSAESENIPNVLSIIGASATLMIADTPFDGPLGAVRIGHIDGELVVNPTLEEIEEGDLDLVVAGTKEAVTMVEASSKEVSEQLMLDAMDLAKKEIDKIIELQEELVKQCQKPQTEFVPPERDEELEKAVKDAGRQAMTEALYIPTKQERKEAISEVKDQLTEQFLSDLDQIEDEEEKEIKESSFYRAFSDLEKEIVRSGVLEEGKRIDGRRLIDVRPITPEVGVLPRTHGSSIFTRGETQSLATVTLGTPRETQRVDDLFRDTEKRFMLHYNFPPYSVGEVRRMTGPGRREIGHGLMAESAIDPVFPDKEEWAYSTRVVSEILESNGSSSMASICSASMALMDAGVPIEKPVSGVAMGLMKSGDKYQILTDILGDEDHLGDMDFKVAGTKDGITSLQMDIKIKGVSREILEEALDRARDARLYILNVMNEAISAPRASVSRYAPQLITMQIPKKRIRDLIGPGGKNIRRIIDETGATVDVEDDGTVCIGAEDAETGKQAREMVEMYTQDVEIGKIYEGKVVTTKDFGAFVEVLPGQEGLVHISELADYHVKKTTDIVEEGDRVKVKCVGISDKGIELSKKAADKEEGE
ncbi:MAG: polyribonucleotide nucleotidyltransferase [bacterium]